jgi:fructosamine-3-kinase
MEDLADCAARLLGATAAGARPLLGGDLSEIARVRLADGREVVAKNGPAPRTEAAMLETIRRSGAPAPAVLGVDDDVLVIDVLPDGGALGEAWASLGAAVAILHRAHGTRYGWSRSYAFGTVAIDNGWGDDWPAFWGERRLLAHAAYLPIDLARRLETLAAGLPSRVPRKPAPALLHGDLWGGNVLVADGLVSGLIDPACYYGHGEVDIAMLSLFDSPEPAFFEAYGAREPGFDERKPIYQLWPALVHLRLFGAAYRPMVERLLAASRP